MAKRIDIDIEKAYYKHCAGTNISVMDISKLYKDVHADMAAGITLEDAVKAAIKKYDQKKA